LTRKEIKVPDANGEVYQHLEYFAFGETFVEEHSNTWRTPYLFNGKELDDETGLYYYGARYYDPRTSVWQSTDPLADKYPGWSPYNYVLNNPINYSDPDGRDVNPTLHVTYAGKMTISTIHDLGETFVAGFSYQKINGKPVVTVDVKIVMNYRFVDGPYKAYNPNAKLNLDNPGLHNQVFEHEKSHYEQFSEIAKNENFSYGKHQGKLDVVAEKFFSELDKEFSTKTYSNAQEKQKITKEYESRSQGFWNSVNKQIGEKMANKYKNKAANGVNGVEMDAIEKTMNKLNKKGEKTNYQSGQTPVKVDGKNITQ
jgi:RHS repeat-associated protein